MITGNNFIGNKLSANGDIVHKTLNPRLNSENPSSFFEATDLEIDEAVQLAWSAFKEYRRFSGKERANFLNAIADEILELGQVLIDTYVQESGLPEGRAIGERGRTVFQLRSFADFIARDNWKNSTIDRAEPDRMPMPKADHRRTMIPLGPVVVFAASNFPLAFSTAGGDTASALAAGCPVIVKAHAMHSGVSDLVASAIVKAANETGMPNGVFSNLNGRGRTVGTTLVSHPRIKAVGFTGSISGGRALYDLASRREEPIPVFAEMGSINPVVITPNALAKRSGEIASAYADSINLGAGQFCTNPGLLLVIEGAKTREFINDLAEKVTSIDSQCMLHSSIKQGFVQNSADIISQSEVETVGGMDSDVGDNFATSQIASVSGSQFLVNPKLRHEVFGPFSLVVRCKNESQLIEIINDLDGQLTGSIIAEEHEDVALEEIIDALANRVGRIIYNGVPTGVEVCPSMQHGGPYPASTDPRFTAVGTHAIDRWLRPICYQSFPERLLPLELR